MIRFCTHKGIRIKLAIPMTKEMCGGCTIYRSLGANIEKRHNLIRSVLSLTNYICAVSHRNPHKARVRRSMLVNTNTKLHYSNMHSSFLRIIWPLHFLKIDFISSRNWWFGMVSHVTISLASVRYMSWINCTNEIPWVNSDALVFIMLNDLK